MHNAKDFHTWTILKQVIQDRSKVPPGYKEQEVWWAQLGLNVGDEEDGKDNYFSRPVLVVKGFSRNLAWVIPLTSVPKEGKYYYAFMLNSRTSTVILSQLKALDVRRFTTKIGVMDTKQFEELRSKLKYLCHKFFPQPGLTGGRPVGICN